MNTDFEKKGAQAPKCLLCSRTYSEHTFESRDICNCYIGPEPELTTLRRCSICVFMIDTLYEATKPTLKYGSAGRAKTKQMSLSPTEYLRGVENGNIEPTLKELRNILKSRDDKLAEVQVWMDERGRNSTSYGSHADAYEVAARKLREAIKSSPVCLAAQNTDEGLPSSDAAKAGDYTDLSGSALARWCYGNPNIAAMTIEGLREVIKDAGK